MNKHQKIKIVLAVGLVAVLCIVVYFLVLQPKATFEASNAVEKVDRPEVGLEFSYLAGPDALSLFEPASLTAPTLSAFIIMPSDEFLKVRSQEAQDTPPSISIFVFDNPEPARVRTEATASSTEEPTSSDKLRLWAEENEGFTGITEASADVEEVKVDGLKGIKYKNEALYKQEIYLFSYQRKVYMFAGQYENDGDDMQGYFEDILASVSFN